MLQLPRATLTTESIVFCDEYVAAPNVLAFSLPCEACGSLLDGAW